MRSIQPTVGKITSQHGVSPATVERVGQLADAVAVIEVTAIERFICQSVFACIGQQR